MSDDDIPIGSDGGSNGDDEIDQSAPTKSDGDIVRVFIEDEMRHSYLGYAMSVIVGPCATGCQRRIETGTSPLPLWHGSTQ